MNSRAARDHRICELARNLFRFLTSLDHSEFPGDWHQQTASAVLSIGSNWVEGHGKRGTGKVTVAMWRHARGSAYEAAFQFECAGFVEQAAICDEISDLLDNEIESSVSTSLESNDSQVDNVVKIESGGPF